MDETTYSYDIAALRVFCHDDDEEVARFLSGYVDLARKDLAGLTEAWNSGDVAAAKEKAHKMKNILALLKAQPHTELAERIIREDESRIRKEKLPEKFEACMTQMFAELTEAYGR